MQFQLFSLLVTITASRRFTGAPKRATLSSSRCSWTVEHAWMQRTWAKTSHCIWQLLTVTWMLRKCLSKPSRILTHRTSMATRHFTMLASGATSTSPKSSWVMVHSSRSPIRTVTRRLTRQNPFWANVCMIWLSKAVRSWRKSRLRIRAGWALRRVRVTPHCHVSKVSISRICSFTRKLRSVRRARHGVDVGRITMWLPKLSLYVRSHHASRATSTKSFRSFASSHIRIFCRSLALAIRRSILSPSVSTCREARCTICFIRQLELLSIQHKRFALHSTSPREWLICTRSRESYRNSFWTVFMLWWVGSIDGLCI